MFKPIRLWTSLVFRRESNLAVIQAITIKDHAYVLRLMAGCGKWSAFLYAYNCHLTSNTTLN